MGKSQCTQVPVCPVYHKKLMIKGVYKRRRTNEKAARVA
jgi:hypothetical protein